MAGLFPLYDCSTGLLIAWLAGQTAYYAVLTRSVPDKSYRQQKKKLLNSSKSDSSIALSSLASRLSG
jgi:hypothetical protein